MKTLKEYVFEKELELKKISKIRDWETEKDNPDKCRNNAEIDYARVMYSSSFRRLQGKMQLLIPGSKVFYRNRLTHSLEVSQISRFIAKNIGMKDTLTVQTCSLAHDLGNPPFGHAGEVVINQLNDKFPYEGNAQTFRILTNIEDRFCETNGLNLTLRTLLGVVKYPYRKTINHKKFLYNTDYDIVKEWARLYSISLKTIDCEIMDLADEIAYAAHDLEDSLKMKYFTIDDLVYEFSISKYKSSKDDLVKLIESAKTYARKARRYETSEEYSVLFQKELTSSLVKLLACDIGLIKSKEKYKLGYKQFENISKGLKELTFKAVTRKPDIIRYEQLGKKVINGLYTVFSDEIFNKDLVLLPAEYRDIDDKTRTIIDYIGGMMDSYAIEQYKIYFGLRSLDSVYSE